VVMIRKNVLGNNNIWSVMRRCRRQKPVRRQGCYRSKGIRRRRRATCDSVTEGERR
jgi:hypothetical protein